VGVAINEIPTANISDPIEFGCDERRPGIVQSGLIQYPHIRHHPIASRPATDDGSRAAASAHADFGMIARLYMIGENQQHSHGVSIAPVLREPPQPSV
jgi:hypothetical protein